MPVIDRASLPAMALPRQVVQVDALGGEVIVQGLDMPGLMRFTAARRDVSQLLDGESDQAAAERAAGNLVPLMLSLAVWLDDGPAYTQAQWAAFGVRNPGVVMDLFDTAVRLSGQDTAAEKKT